MTPPQSVLKTKPGQKTTTAASGSGPSGAKAPVTPPKNPPPKPPAGLKATPKSPPPERDHACGLSTSSYTEVEVDKEDSPSSDRKESRERKKSRSRTPLVRRPKGAKQRKKFAQQEEEQRRSPKVTFAEPLEEGWSGEKGKGGGEKGKTKRKKQRLQRQERQAEGKRKRQGKAETAERRGRSRQGSWACWRQKLRAYDNRPLHVLGHTRQLVKGLASVQTGMGASLRKALYSPNGRGGRVPGSSIFPLPMPQSCRDALQRVLDSTDKKRDRAGKTWSDCHEAWCGLTILGLNNALSFTTDVGPAVNPAQEKVCELLSKDCCDFVRGDGLGKDGSRSRASEVPWSQKIGDLSVNYTGDIVEKARWLTWEQVQPGLPPEGRGGSLEAVSFCDSWVKKHLENPALTRLKDEEVVDPLPHAVVRATQDHWRSSLVSW